MVTRERKLSAVSQDDAIFAMKPGLQLMDEIQTNYRGAMDANKFLGVELRLKAADSFPQQVGFLSAVDRNIVALGFNPVYLRGLKKIYASARFDYQTLQIVFTSLQFFQQGEDALVHATDAVSISYDLCLGALP